MIDKLSRKVLKFIAKIGKLNFQVINEKFGEHSEQAISLLCNNGYLEKVIPYPTFNKMEFIYAITPKGKAYFEERRTKRIHFWIPTGISIFAAIGAYREEITILLQAIEKLLK